ncbi:MAG: MOSC domain-containing protein [Pseudomonadota bacterium]
MTITLAAINRYPIKGLKAQSLESARLSPSKGLIGDRLFSLARGSAGYSLPRQMPPAAVSILDLENEERLARLEARYDDDSQTLQLLRSGQERPLAQARVDTPLGRSLISQFFADFLGDSRRGLPRLIDSEEALGPSNWVSLINLASLKDVERVARQKLDPARLRANLWLEGAEAWAEREWNGCRFRLGGAVLQVTAPLECAGSANVNPREAQRDINLPLLMRKGFMHQQVGVQLTVLEGGRIQQGDRLQPFTQ